MFVRRLRAKPSPLGKQQGKTHLLRNWMSVSVIMRWTARQIDWDGTSLAFKPTQDQCDPCTFGLSIGIRRMKLKIFHFILQSTSECRGR